MKRAKKEKEEAAPQGASDMADKAIIVFLMTNEIIIRDLSQYNELVTYEQEHGSLSKKDAAVKNDTEGRLRRLFQMSTTQSRLISDIIGSDKKLSTAAAKTGMSARLNKSIHRSERMLNMFFELSGIRDDRFEG